MPTTVSETRFELTPVKYIGGMAVMVSEGIELEIFVRDTLHGLLGFSCMDESYVGFPALYIGVGSTKGLLLFLF